MGLYLQSNIISIRNFLNNEKYCSSDWNITNYLCLFLCAQESIYLLSLYENVQFTLYTPNETGNKFLSPPKSKQMFALRDFKLSQISLDFPPIPIYNQQIFNVSLTVQFGREKSPLKNVSVCDTRICLGKSKLPIWVIMSQFWWI